MGVVKAGVVAGAEYKAPVTPFLCAGDRARLEMDLDLLKSSLDVLGTWNDNIVEVCKLHKNICTCIHIHVPIYYDCECGCIWIYMYIIQCACMYILRTGYI